MTFRATLSAFFFLLIIASVSVGQQSLGDAARQARKDKPNESGSRVYTNDDFRPGSSSDLKSSESSDKTANASDSSTDKTASPDKSADADKTAADKKKDKASGDEQAALDKDWQDKIAAQKDAIALIERELDVLQRESRLRTANYYADAGSRLRDQKKYAEDDRKYHEQIDGKQKDLDAAKAKLDSIKEEARKAGASPGVIG